MDLATDYINSARRMTSMGSYSSAFDFYISAFDLNPNFKKLMETEFRYLLNELNNYLVSIAHAEEVFINFGRALNVFPNNIYLLNDIGKYLFKYGFYIEAWYYFQNALKADPGFVLAEKNLNSVKNCLVERWHFRMLNDKIRNEAYRVAIQKSIVPRKDIVLDVGTGTGLLSLYAHECSPRSIIACDGSETMAQLAKKVMQSNKVKTVNVVNSMSTYMHSPDLSGRVSLLLTETFDAGLFGEDILKTLSHAWEHLMSEHGRIIPNKAEFFIIGAKSEYLNMKYQLCSHTKNILNIANMNVHILTYNETYDCEDVHLFEDLKYITEPQSLLKVDFNNYANIQNILTTNHPFNINLTAKENGRINILIGWFNLYLTENVTITTDPRSKKRANAWQQAIFFNYVPQSVLKNQSIYLQFLMNHGKLALVSQSSSFKYISPQMLRFLNDTDYINLIKDSVPSIFIYLAQLTDTSQVDIVDLNPFPLFGLMMLKRGAKSLVCYAKNKNDVIFLNAVFTLNNVILENITILTRGNWVEHNFGDEKYHVIFANVFELTGDLNLPVKEKIRYLRSRNLKNGGLFLPAKMRMMGQIVSSNWVDVNNSVNDQNVNDYSIAKHINKYRVSQNINMDFTTMDYIALTEPTILTTINDRMISEVTDTPVVRDGEANAVLCWYVIEIIEQYGEISTFRSNSFINGMMFLASPKVKMLSGDTANILRCIDVDGSFKLIIDVDNKY